MSFFAASANTYKPQVRQEGFHLPSPPPSVPSPLDPMFQHFLPDPFRKQDPGGPAHSLDFNDELASLIPQSPQHTSHERSTQSPDDNDHHPHAAHYRHNIFDISAPANFHSHQQQQQQFSNSFDYSQQQQQQQQQQHQGPPPHFNSTLPALSSSLRYDPHEPLPPPTPSSYSSHIDYHRSTSTGPARSRSRSRDVSTNGGPARTARPKRGSISGTSPPRAPNPHAILIPPSHASHHHHHPHGSLSRATNGNPVSPLSLHSLSTSANGGSTNGWFPAHADYASLPTPDSLGGAPAFGSYPALGVSPKEAGAGGAESPALPTPGMDAASKQGDRAAIANEKRRRRRESHNAVERRRRDNINEKIAELATLIPEGMLDPGATPTSPTELDLASPLGLVPPLAGASSPKDGDEGAGEGRQRPASSSGAKSGGGGGGAKESAEKDDGGVKANKGMILRKSVDYIRYLQQLVAAQAARNRELEAALAGGGGGGSPGEEVVLHEEGVYVFGGHGHGHGHGGMSQRRAGGRSLERVLEQHNEDDEMDGKGVGAGAGSPGESGSGSGEEGAEAGMGGGERGRARRREGVAVKEEEGDGMEVS